MGTVLENIDGDVREWIGRQRMFFVGTAPSGSDGHVNVSPKGDMRTFRVLDPLRVAYVDLFGSGIETAAHLRDNGRIVIMFCAFEGPPKIIRLHGRGRVIEQDDARHEELIARFDLPGVVRYASRAVVAVDVTRVADSCGFVVPQMTFKAERQQLFKLARTWARKRGPDAVHDYADVNNDISIDSLPALRRFGGPVTPEQRERYEEENRKQQAPSGKSSK